MVYKEKEDFRQNVASLTHLENVDVENQEGKIVQGCDFFDYVLVLFYMRFEGIVQRLRKTDEIVESHVRVVQIVQD
jgi:hypothetical protein